MVRNKAILFSGLGFIFIWFIFLVFGPYYNTETYQFLKYATFTNQFELSLVKGALVPPLYFLLLAIGKFFSFSYLLTYQIINSLAFAFFIYFANKLWIKYKGEENILTFNLILIPLSVFIYVQAYALPLQVTLLLGLVYHLLNLDKYTSLKQEIIWWLITYAILAVSILNDFTGLLGSIVVLVYVLVRQRDRFKVRRWLWEGALYLLILEYVFVIGIWFYFGRYSFRGFVRTIKFLKADYLSGFDVFYWLFGYLNLHYVLGALLLILVVYLLISKKIFIPKVDSELKYIVLIWVGTLFLGFLFNMPHTLRWEYLLPIVPLILIALSEIKINSDFWSKVLNYRVFLIVLWANIVVFLFVYKSPDYGNLYAKGKYVKDGGIVSFVNSSFLENKAYIYSNAPEYLALKFYNERLNYRTLALGCLPPYCNPIYERRLKRFVYNLEHGRAIIAILNEVPKFYKDSKVDYNDIVEFMQENANVIIRQFEDGLLIYSTLYEYSISNFVDTSSLFLKDSLNSVGVKYLYTNDTVFLNSIVLGGDLVRKYDYKHLDDIKGEVYSRDAILINFGKNDSVLTLFEEQGFKLMKFSDGFVVISQLWENDTLWGLVDYLYANYVDLVTNNLKALNHYKDTIANYHIREIAPKDLGRGLINGEYALVLFNYGAKYNLDSLLALHPSLKVIELEKQKVVLSKSLIDSVFMNELRQFDYIHTFIANVRRPINKVLDDSTYRIVCIDQINELSELREYVERGVPVVIVKDNMNVFEPKFLRTLYGIAKRKTYKWGTVFYKPIRENTKALYEQLRNENENLWNTAYKIYTNKPILLEAAIGDRHKYLQIEFYNAIKIRDDIINGAILVYFEDDLIDEAYKEFYLNFKNSNEKIVLDTFDFGFAVYNKKRFYNIKFINNFFYITNVKPENYRVIYTNNISRFENQISDTYNLASVPIKCYLGCSVRNGAYVQEILIMRTNIYSNQGAVVYFYKDLADKNNVYIPIRSLLFNFMANKEAKVRFAKQVYFIYPNQ